IHTNTKIIYRKRIPAAIVGQKVGLSRLKKRYKTVRAVQKTAENCDQKHSIEIRPVLRVH
ncbi:TPA: hypothetical protein ACQVJS_004255, partial [Serratia marcescens]